MSDFLDNIGDLLLILLPIITIIFFVFAINKTYNHWSDLCINKGGIYYHFVCYDKNVVIDIRD